MRGTLGGLTLYHAWLNGRFSDPTGVIGKNAQRYATNGWDYATALSYLHFMSETVCATLLILGLFTRFAAAAIAIELAVITFGVYWPTGFHFRTPGGGAELPFLWGMMVFVVALRGGGPFSLDRKIGWEL
jgi:putative oxidoreductase